MQFPGQSEHAEGGDAERVREFVECGRHGWDGRGADGHGEGEWGEWRSGGVE